MNKDWNPELYLRFNKERTQPALDLLNRIDMATPRKVLDVGCGPGNSTQILVQRWPAAAILGIDSSVAMIAKAQADYPQAEWAVMDALHLTYVNEFDVIFSNAVIHWLPDHETLLKNLIQALTDNGVLAIQMPLYHEMPVYALVETLYQKRFPESSFDSSRAFNFHSADYYYDILARMPYPFALWETSYFHIMNSHQQILEMIQSAGLKPYLDEIPSEPQRVDFAHEVLHHLPAIYKSQPDGRVLFPFKRLFLLFSKH